MHAKNANKKSKNVALSTMETLQTSFTVRIIRIIIATFTPQKISFIITDLSKILTNDASASIATKGASVSPKSAQNAPVLPLNL